MRQNILAVDDEPHMLTLLERIISEKTNFGITTTSNSLEIPDLLKENEYDLIVSDLKMPGMDGIDILRYLRENNRTEAVIIITAFGSLESAAESLAQGVFDYIVKPFKKEQIIFSIERAMRCQMIRREAASMAKVFAIEPFNHAIDAFKKEYLQRMTTRVGTDPEKLAKLSGLSEEEIEAILKKD